MAAFAAATETAGDSVTLIFNRGPLVVAPPLYCEDHTTRHKVISRSRRLLTASRCSNSCCCSDALMRAFSLQLHRSAARAMRSERVDASTFTPCASFEFTSDEASLFCSVSSTRLLRSPSRAARNCYTAAGVSADSARFLIRPSSPSSSPTTRFSTSRACARRARARRPERTAKIPTSAPTSTATTATASVSSTPSPLPSS